MSEVRILGANGLPLPVARPSGPPGARALHNGGGAPYDAASNTSPQMRDWQPYLWSPDAEGSQYFKDRLVSRARDVERNDGWAHGGITKILDTAIGADFRPISKPDYRALAYYTGNKSFDATWADEFGHALDACYRTWSDDIGHYCDAMQCLTMPQMFYVAMRHKLIDSQCLAVMLYRPETVAPGGARYATSVQLVDPDRLSNPQLRFDDNVNRGGVVVDQFGAPQAYHIRRAHQGDWFSAEKSVQWDLIPRATSWGRPIVVHDYDHARASQHHGSAGVLTPILQRLKMLVKYDSVELDAAIINAIFAAYIKSPFDREMVEQALSNPENDESPLSGYQQQRNDFWDGKRTSLGDVQMTHLFPGEEIGTVTASRPSSNFEPFEVAVLRHISSGMGITYEQLTSDFSRTNYSSFRGATNEVLKTFNRRAKNFESGFANPIRAAFIEEVMDVEDLPLPSGAPAFEEFRAAYSRCRWLRPGRGWVDPVAEKQGSILGMEAGLSTLEIEVAENVGEDWEEMIDARAIELKRFKDLGLTPPTWAQVMNTGGANNAGTPPKADTPPEKP